MGTTRPNATLDEVYQRWRSTHPTPTDYDSEPSGYRHCAVPGCPTRIADGQERANCYWHGGKPNERWHRRSVVETIEEYLDELRSGERHDGLVGRPYRP